MAIMCKPQRPSCHNRPDFTGEGTVWRTGCPHWHPGGNADRLASNPARGGAMPWSRCDGCRHKDIARPETP